MLLREKARVVATALVPVIAMATKYVVVDLDLRVTDVKKDVIMFIKTKLLS